jgi:hypothetical protein
MSPIPSFATPTVDAANFAHAVVEVEVVVSPVAACARDGVNSPQEIWYRRARPMGTRRRSIRPKRCSGPNMSGVEGKRERQHRLNAREARAPRRPSPGLLVLKASPRYVAEASQLSGLFGQNLLNKLGRVIYSRAL